MRSCTLLPEKDNHSTRKLLKDRALRADTWSVDITVDYRLTPQNNGTVQFTRPDSPFYISPKRHRSPHFAFRTENPPTGDTELKPSTIRTVFDSPILLYYQEDQPGIVPAKPV